ncbi:NUAK SNF1-like kinase 1 [Gryganskiella cystojenkinii]|nr:NUAK SNF1-like kinase 1 [Gryganskiella cystojenkinii]
MASIPSSVAVSEAQGVGTPSSSSSPHPSKNDLFFTKPVIPSLSSTLSSTHTQHSTNDDAMVPSIITSTRAAPTRQNSNWDDSFFNGTPTPKPPPRLAPIPRSPTTPTSTAPSTPTARSPPPPIIIPNASSTSTTIEGFITSSNTPILSKGDHFELSKAKPRYPSSLSSSLPHTRSLSHSQAHSHHGSNIFAHPSMTGSSSAGENVITAGRGGASPSLGSRLTLALVGGGLAASSNPSFNPDHIPICTEDHLSTEENLSPRNQSILNHEHHHHHESPASSGENRHVPHNNYRHSHQLPSTPLHRGNPLLTPSTSQSNLFSNLPSPVTRGTTGSTNIFRDPPPSTSTTHSNLSSWVVPSSSQTSETVNGDDISETSLLMNQDQQQQPGSASVANISSTPISSSSSSSARKIYPGLKNSVGPYKLLHNIGRGSFSEVKMAVDTRTGDHVAIKVMSRAMIQSSDRLGISVQRESDLLKSIHHPNIIGFREVVETSLQMCIVLDYASGGELFEFVADKRALSSEADIQFIFAQIVDAVHYLHENNVVHRDLKLENVLLEPRTGAPLRPNVKLTDFGLAKIIEPDSPLLTTRCGSEDYAAPEIILGQPYDGREADIWSLGVVLYALLVGFLPFNMRPGMSRKNFLSMVAHAEFGFPGETVSIKRASLMDLHQRNGSSTSLASTHSASAAEIFQQQRAAAASDSGSVSGTTPSTTTLLPAALSESSASTSTSSLTTKNLAAANAAAEEIAHTMIVPKMRGVSAVSDQSKDLVRWLLQTQGAHRPMSLELYNHPWVVAGRQAVATAAAAEAAS